MSTCCRRRIGVASKVRQSFSLLCLQAEPRTALPIRAVLGAVAGRDCDGVMLDGCWRFRTTEYHTPQIRGWPDSTLSYLRVSLLERMRSAVNGAFVKMFCDQHHADW